MSLKHNIIGTGLVVAGGISSLLGLGGACVQIGNYDPIFTAEIYCKDGYLSKEECEKVENQKTEQHKKMATWASIGVVALGTAYAGHRYRERRSLS